MALLCAGGIDHCEICPIYPNCERWMPETENVLYMLGVADGDTYAAVTKNGTISGMRFNNAREAENYGYRTFKERFSHAVVFDDHGNMWDPKTGPRPAKT